MIDGVAKTTWFYYLSILIFSLIYDLVKRCSLLAVEWLYELCEWYPVLDYSELRSWPFSWFDTLLTFVLAAAGFVWEDMKDSELLSYWTWKWSIELVKILGRIKLFSLDAKS
jgi:hypothetical protein